MKFLRRLAMTLFPPVMIPALILGALLLTASRCSAGVECSRDTDGKLH